jgi:hypothetical protein
VQARVGCDGRAPLMWSASERARDAAVASPRGRVSWAEELVSFNVLGHSLEAVVGTEV